jgi:hypothetical protein
MMVGVSEAVGSAEHWDGAYSHGDTGRSWFQRQALPSLRMVEAAGITSSDSVIDVGGGASSLVDELLERGHTDVAVLDVSVEWLRRELAPLGPARRGCRVTGGLSPEDAGGVAVELAE